MNQQSYRLNITGKSSNEIYSVSYPDNLIKFISFDLTPFADKCSELCRANINTLEQLDIDEISELRKSVAECHKYIEKNIHGVFEKIVTDCCIDYICRHSKIDEAALWDSFSPCKNPFQTALFSRLCEFRYNRAINQWVNIVRVQEYARKKTDFVFGQKLDSRHIAIANAGYFDLLFNIAANEMGSGELSASKVYSGMRTPNSPFVMSKLSREIMRNLFGELDTSVSVDADKSDKTAMDVFDAIKTFIPDEPSSFISLNSIMRMPQTVYIPESFKAMIDLEIDALLESGGIMQKCERCHEYFLKDENYNYNYCSRVENGRSCLDVVGERKGAAVTPVTSEVVDTTVLYARCDQLYKEMSERVNVDINQRDFSDWYKYMALIRENVVSGTATMEDFENFAEYSRTIKFDPKTQARSVRSLSATGKDGSKSDKPDLKTKAKISETAGTDSKPASREVRPFEFERVERPSAPSILPPSTIPPSVPIPYAPVNTVRVIRGIAPTGVKELPPVDGIRVTEPQTPIKTGEFQPVLDNTDNTEAHNHDTEEPKIAPAPVIEPAADKPAPAIASVSAKPTSSAKTGDDNKKRRQKTRIDKYGKGLLLQNPYEKGMLQNPYIRDLISPDNKPSEDTDSKPDNKTEDKDDNKTEPIKKSVKNPYISYIEKVAENSELAEDSENTEKESADEKPLLDFSGILSGIKRNDGFGDDDESGEDVIVSHKTKRVMDTVFGKNNVINPFVKNDNNTENEQ